MEQRSRDSRFGGGDGDGARSGRGNAGGASGGSSSRPGNDKGVAVTSAAPQASGTGPVSDNIAIPSSAVPQPQPSGQSSGSGPGSGLGSTTPQPGPTSPAKPIRRRMRMITSCLECRRRKLRCDKAQPCSHCLKNGRECRYLGPKLDEASQLRLTQFKDQVGSLERQLVHEADGKEGQASRKQRSDILADDVEGGNAEDGGGALEPSVFLPQDITYDDDDGYDDEGLDGLDDMIDLGVLVGKMRITERIGGMPRPQLAEEMSAAGVKSQPAADTTSSSSTATATPSPPSWPSFLLPGPNYIPPSSNFFMGGFGSSPALENLLPTQGAADRLMCQYFDAVHPVAPCAHRPSLEADYREFWRRVMANIEPRPSLQALVFAAMFSAAVSMDEGTVGREFGRTKKSLYEALKLGTETALSKANFLRTTRVQTLQAFVMYLIPLCRGEVSRAHSVLVGTAVRMAECMGLHRDGETYNLNPLDTHVRRIIWHQLCFLDIRTCEAQGPLPAIRREEYDTRLPLNLDEELLTRDGGWSPRLSQLPSSPQRYQQQQQQAAADHWTPALLPLIRFEINEMMRVIWVDRRKLEARQTTLTAVLSKIENFRRLMFEKYGGLLDDRVALQRYTRLVMNLLLYRLHLMVLHAFWSRGETQLSSRLRDVLMSSGIMILEIGIELETNPSLRDWAWYCGAYHQFQVALLLASEVYYHPDRTDAPRIWVCLDYIFNTDRTLPQEAKGMQILGEVMSKTAMYHRLRKSRYPVDPQRPDGQQASVDARRSTAQTQTHHSAGQASQPHQPMTEHSAPTSGVAAGRTYGGSGGGGSSVGGTFAPATSAPPRPAPPPPPPPSNAVYAGVSDGQILWSVGPNPYMAASQHPPDGNPATGSMINANVEPAQMHQSPPEVDWEIVNSLFPVDPNTGYLNLNGYGDPFLSMDWQQGGST